MMTEFINAKDWGVKENTLCTAALQAAIDAACDGCGVVYIPRGTYLTGTLNLKNVTLCLGKGACLKASENLEDYRYIDYVHMEMGRVLPLLYSMETDGVRICGEGEIDLSGDAFFDLNKPRIPQTRVPMTEAQLRECTVSYVKRPNQPIFFYHCTRVRIQDVKIANAPSWTMSFNECVDVLVSGVTIRNSLIIPNCDGMHFCSCREVGVHHCHISAGDDCIAVTCATNWDVPCERVTISDCVLRSCSKAISIGYMHSIVRDVTVTNCLIMESNRAIVLMASAGTGLVENVCISNVRLDTRIQAGDWWGNGEPLCLMGTWHDNPDYPVRPAAKRFDTAIRHVSVSNVVCSGENAIAVIGENNSIQDVLMENIQFTQKESANLPLKGRMIDLAPGEQTAILPEDDADYWLFIKQSRRVRVRGVWLTPLAGRPLRHCCMDCEQVSVECEEHEQP
ncbi:MAG: glycoside hydrolase family 28 protein [Aristaeellaceae bacterium]